MLAIGNISHMKCIPVLYALCLGLLHAREPQFGSIDYAKPSEYLAWPDSLGEAAAIREQAAQLKAGSDLETIRNVLNWTERTLRFDGQKAYAWRNYNDVIREKAYGGCADQSIVCGVLLKAAGIPTVWVKTMDVNWIWDFRKGRSFQSWSGHVFLEVWVDRKWMLLDPGGRLVYQDYRPQARILPGNRFAYDKGNDPKAMVMSLQWEEWKSQTEAYFRALDESQLPVDTAGATEVNPVAWVAGNSPYYQAMSQMAVEAGLTVKKSFNADYDTNLPQARGNVLLVEMHDGAPIVPLDVLEKHFPGSAAGLQQADGFVRVAETMIVFLDFARPLQKLRFVEGIKKGAVNLSSPANGGPPIRPETNRTSSAVE
jgi:hypothetical protein